MAHARKGQRERTSSRNGGANGNGDGLSGGFFRADTPGTTGRYLVLFREGAAAAGTQMLGSTVGVQVTSAADFSASAVPADTLAEAEALMLPQLGIAIVNAPPDQAQALGVAMSDTDSPILAIEEERFIYALTERQLLADVIAPTPAQPVEAPRALSNGNASGNLSQYLRGYQDAVNQLVDQLLETGPAVTGDVGMDVLFDEAELTWGLQATGVGNSLYTGQGVRVAVLDTGMELSHPDFVGRRITAQSFIPGQEAQDGHGHGTHCIGTACGPRQPGQLPRYGIASQSEIFVGKVLSDEGRGTDGGILAGIEWAINNNCAVISMSLGARTWIGQSFSRVFEAAARRALAAGALIIAAAGNESQRPWIIAPVGHPANCPSILSVGALDAQLTIASFSCGGLNPQGGQVDLAGPGVAVRSSWIRPQLYRSISGTSMATPHVAGIAALHAEANPDMRGGALGWLLLQSARHLNLPIRDAGAGLVQAP